MENNSSQEILTSPSVKEVLDAIQDCLTVTIFRDAGLSKEDAITAQTIARDVIERVESHFSKKKFSV